MLDSYNKVIGTILDSQAPFDTITCRKRPSDPWYDAECRAAKKSTRKLELRYKKTSSPIDRSLWTSSLKHQHKLAGKKKQAFWVNKINSTKNPRSLWQSIDEISGRSSSKAKVESTLSALDLSSFSVTKSASSSQQLSTHLLLRSPPFLRAALFKPSIS